MITPNGKEYLFGVRGVGEKESFQLFGQKHLAFSHDISINRGRMM